MLSAYGGRDAAVSWRNLFISDSLGTNQRRASQDLGLLPGYSVPCPQSCVIGCAGDDRCAWALMMMHLLESLDILSPP